MPVSNFALEILNFLDLSQIVSYELSFYYKINCVEKGKLFQAFDELLFSYCAFFVPSFAKIFEDSIQILEAPKRNLGVHFSLVDTGHS